jgi:hypothetical protein
VVQHGRAHPVDGVDHLGHEDALDGAGGDDPPVVQQHHVVAVRSREVEVVQRHERRGAGAGEPADQRERGQLRVHVQVVRRLVEQQLGLLGERPGQVHALALAARQRLQRPVGEVAQLDGGEGRGDDVPVAVGVTRPERPVRRPAQQHRVAHAQGDVGRLLLLHERDAAGAVTAAGGADVRAVQPHERRPGRPDRARGRDAGDQPQQRRLAGAVGAQQATDAAGRDGAVDAVEDQPSADLQRRLVDAQGHETALRSHSR